MIATAERRMNSTRIEMGKSDDDLLVIGVWSIMGVLGISTNLIILAGICHNKKLLHCTSYWLVMSLGFCDMGMLIVCLAFLIPVTVMHERYVEKVHLSNAAGVFVYDAFWYTGVLHLMIMSINRYVNICKPKHYLKLFSRGKTFCIVLALYLAGTSLAAPGLFACCYLVFNYEFYAGQYDPLDTPYRYVDMAVNGFGVMVMTFCYVSIVVRVRKSRIMLAQYRQLCRDTRTALNYAKMQRQNSISVKLARLLRPQAPLASRREVKLFFQFATVSVIFFLTFFTWSWLPHLSSDSKWIGFVVTSLFFVNNSINPLVYFIFNSVLRRQIRKMLCPCTDRKIDALQRRQHRSTNGHQPLSSEEKPDQRVIDKRSILRRFRSGGSVRYERTRDRVSNRLMRRRSTAFENEDKSTWTPMGSYNDSSNDAETNTTCNLMAMAAFLNTTTITGGVLLKSMEEDEEKNRLITLNMIKQSTMDTSIECTSSAHRDDISGGRASLPESIIFGSQEIYIIINEDEQSIHL